MIRIWSFIAFSFAAISTANGGETPFNYFNINFGIANYKKPIIYTYSFEYCRDFNISKKSSFLLGLEWENFYQKEKFERDTNFLMTQNQTGSLITMKYYNKTDKVMFVNFSMGYKYWLKKSEINSIYFQTEINFNFVIKEVSEFDYYYRDTSQILYLGPYTLSYIEKDDSAWLFDNIRPAISFGFLRKMNKRMAYHLKLDLILSSPHHTPRDQAYVYPKLGFGLTFR